jgi:precorrin-2 dehydrogenase
VKPYPLIISLEGKRALVLGGGKVASRKVSGLLESGATVCVVSPEVEPELEKLATEGSIEWVAEAFVEEHMDRHPDVALVFGTTDNREVNVRIHAAATERKIPCNIADVPDLCSFIVPAVVKRGDLTISISTGGASPALARRIREDLEKIYGPEYETFAKVLGELRKLVLSTDSNHEENKHLFLRVVDSDLLKALRENDRNQALRILNDILPADIDPEAAIQAAARTE